MEHESGTREQTGYPISFNVQFFRFYTAARITEEVSMASRAIAAAAV